MCARARDGCLLCKFIHIRQFISHFSHPQTSPGQHGDLIVDWTFLPDCSPYQRCAYNITRIPLSRLNVDSRRTLDVLPFYRVLSRPAYIGRSSAPPRLHIYERQSVRIADSPMIAHFERTHVGGTSHTQYGAHLLATRRRRLHRNRWSGDGCGDGTEMRTGRKWIVSRLLFRWQDKTVSITIVRSDRGFRDSEARLDSIFRHFSDNNVLITVREDCATRAMSNAAITCCPVEQVSQRSLCSAQTCVPQCN